MSYVELINTESRIVSVLTVRESFEKYIKQEAEKATLACELQVLVGHTTDLKYKDMVSKKMLLDFPITTHDMTNKISIFRSDLTGARENKLGKNLVGCTRKNM